MRYHEFLTEASKVSEIILKMKAEYPDHNQYIDEQVLWARDILKKSDRISWWINIVYESLKSPTLYNIEELGENIAHYCSYSDRVTSISSYQFGKKKPDQIINDLSNYLDEYETKQAAKARKKVIPQKGDYKLIEFDDGSCWWFVNRAYCDQERESGRHCGNVTGQRKTKQRILSYRVNDVAMLTFILEPNKKLGEMKQWANQHPQPKYHPYIMALLLNPIVKGISGGGWVPHMNFSIFDLDEQNLSIIQQQKPILIEDQINVSPTEALKAPPSIRAQYYNKIISKNKGIDTILNADGSYNDSLDTWGEAIRINKKLSLNVPDQYINEFRDTILKVLRKQSILFVTQASNAIRNDYDILKKFVTFEPRNIGYVQTNYEKYKELCIIAVEKGWEALEYIPKELRDHEMCLAAVKQHGNAFTHVPEELRDYEICLAAVTRTYWVIRDVPKPPILPKKQYLKLCLAAVKQNSNVLMYVPPEYRNPEICLAATTRDGYALLSVPKELRGYEICLAAVSQKSSAFWALGVLKDEPPILPKHEYYEICLAAVKHDGRALQNVPEEFKDYEICLAAVTNNGKALYDVSKPPILPEDQYLEICLAAVTQNEEVLNLALLKYQDRIKQELGL